MQKRRSDQPSNQRHVLTRIPAPPATPSKYIVCPAPAQNQTGGEKDPACQCPAARAAQPHAIASPHKQGGHAHGKGDQHAGITGIQHGRMNDHARMAQEWIQAPSICGREVVAHKGIGKKQFQKNEKAQHNHHDHGGVGQKRFIFAPRAKHGGTHKARHEQTPE